MWVWFEILKERFTWSEFKYWYVVAFLSPLVGFGSMIGTPDVPLIFFWSLSVLFFLRALKKQKAADYFLLGSSLGLGFCSKYHIVLFVPFTLLYLIREKRLREVTLSRVALTFLGGFFLSLPVVIWNIQNDFASFRFQIDHGLGSQTWSPEWTIGYLGAELILVFPLVLWAALKAKIPSEFKVLQYLAWGPLLFFFLSSFRGAVELNWPNTAFPAVFALVLFSTVAQKIFKWTSVFWLAVYVFAFSAVLFLPPGSKVAKPFREPYRFRFLSPLQSQYTPLYAGTYQIASTIWYENKIPIYKLRDMSRYDFYDTLPKSVPQEDTFYVIQENWSLLPDWVEEMGYKATVVKELEPHYIVVKVSK